MLKRYSLGHHISNIHIFVYKLQADISHFTEVHKMNRQTNQLVDNNTIKAKCQKH